MDRQSKREYSLKGLFGMQGHFSIWALSDDLGLSVVDLVPFFSLSTLGEWPAENFISFGGKSESSSSSKKARPEEKVLKLQRVLRLLVK